MICTRCATAADNQADADQHCNDPRCTCQHRTDRYQPARGLAAIEAAYDRLNRLTAQARALEEHHRAAVPARLAQIAEQLTAHIPDEARAAGIHFAVGTTED